MNSENLVIMITSEILKQFERNWDSGLILQIACMSLLIKYVDFIVHLQG